MISPGKIFTRFFLTHVLLFSSIACVEIMGQEYLRSPYIKVDSVAEGNRAFLVQIRNIADNWSTEFSRNYRDSLNAGVLNIYPGFDGSAAAYKNAIAAGPGANGMRLLADLAWNNFLVSASKPEALLALRELHLAYPGEFRIQGNYALALSMMGNTDSAMKILEQFKKIVPSGFSSVDVEINILANASAPDNINLLKQPVADSFATWVSDKLYAYPANADSIRNALALAIFHRTTAFAAPDKIIARLLLNFADLAAREKDYQYAAAFYKIAESYDETLAPAIAKRQKALDELKQSVSDTFQWASIFFIIPLLAFVVIIAGWIRNRKHHITNDPR